MGNLSVAVRGRKIDTYYHDGKTFIEGRRGTEYTIDYHNNTPNRVKVVLSVDGLNVVTGDATWERGYVVEPWQTISVPGWRKDSNNVAAFEFSSARGSYNQANDSGHKLNIGVIGAMVFNEIVRYRFAPTYINVPYISPVPAYDWWNPRPNVHHWATCGSVGGGIGSAGMNASFNAAPAGASAFTASMATGAAESHSATREVKTSGLKLGKLCAAPEPEVNNVGTGWGANQQFQTHEVSYDFYQMASETLTIYYDDRRGLQERGVNVKEKYRPEPQAFPTYSDGCPSPKYR